MSKTHRSNKGLFLSTIFLATFLIACSSSPKGFLTPTAVSNTIDAEGNVYFGTRYATSGSTYANTYNIDYLHDDGQVYRVQVENITRGTSELGRIEKSTATARKGTSSVRFQTTTTDSSFTQGTVGVYSHQNEGFADNIVVSLIP